MQDLVAGQIDIMIDWLCAHIKIAAPQALTVPEVMAALRISRFKARFDDGDDGAIDERSARYQRLQRTITVPAVAALVGQANWWPSRGGARRSAAGRAEF